eukprot:14635806-Alexandrium_andersonii.AAC.1
MSSVSMPLEISVEEADAAEVALARPVAAPDTAGPEASVQAACGRDDYNKMSSVSMPFVKFAEEEAVRPDAAPNA